MLHMANDSVVCYKLYQYSSSQYSIFNIKHKYWLFLLIKRKTGVHILCCTCTLCCMHNYKETKMIKMQYWKLSFGGGSCLFSATWWGWVTNILCHYEGVGHLFLSNWVFIRPPAHPTLYFLTSPLARNNKPIRLLEIPTSRVCTC